MHDVKQSSSKTQTALCTTVVYGSEMGSWSTVCLGHLPFHLCAQIFYKCCTLDSFTPRIWSSHVYKIATSVSCNIVWYMFSDDESMWIETCISISFDISIKGRTQCVLLVECCELATDNAQNEQHTVIIITWHTWISVQTYSREFANDALVSTFVDSIPWGPLSILANRISSTGLKNSCINNHQMTAHCWMGAKTGGPLQ